MYRLPYTHKHNKNLYIMHRFIRYNLYCLTPPDRWSTLYSSGLPIGGLEELEGGLVAADGVLVGGGVPVGGVVEAVLHRGVPHHDTQQILVHSRPETEVGGGHL